MRRALLAGSVIVVFASMPRLAFGALEVALAVSPREGVVGEPMEVLVRTFAPVGGEGLELPTPSVPYPAPSGLWNVLYPVADYPFDVVAITADAVSVPVTLRRDETDATLWRGTFIPTAAGEWLVEVRNFPEGEPGAAARVMVGAAGAEFGIPIAAIVGLAVGLLSSVLVARFRTTRP